MFVTHFTFLEVSQETTAVKDAVLQYLNGKKAGHSFHVLRQC